MLRLLVAHGHDARAGTEDEDHAGVDIVVNVGDGLYLRVQVKWSKRSGRHGWGRYIQAGIVPVTAAWPASRILSEIENGIAALRQPKAESQAERPPEPMPGWTFGA